MEQANGFSSVSVAAVKRRSPWPIIVILVIIAAIGYFWLSGPAGLSGLFGAPGGDAYQAVFLTNNQVYFGKLADQDKAYVKLTDIFYLQVSQPLQPSEPANNVNLIKLGAELHGPADSMAINRDHILFIEDLRTDSQVVQAIKQYKTQPSQPAVQ